MADTYNYPGEELQLFEEAKNWKKYLAGKIKPYIKGNVLEVGAGIGDTTPYLINNYVADWTCLEPDPKLFELLKIKITEKKTPEYYKAIQGTLSNLPGDLKFDSIIYIDVLEHIEHDKIELEQAASKLNNGGHLIILSPAFQILYSPFDKAIGHYRRYTKKTLRAATQIKHLSELKIFYLESAGMFLLFFNKFFFKKKYPSTKNIRVWEKFFVPISKLLDKVLFYSIGKTVIGIWKYKLDK